MQSQIQPPNHKWTILDIINWTTTYFTSHNIDSPRASAEILLAHVLNLQRIDLYLRYDQPLIQQELVHFKSLIKRRIKREPVAYIIGKRDFWSLDLLVSEQTLIPRPETECLVEVALSFLPKLISSELESSSLRILEMGTGSGAIILAIASDRPNHRFFASDRLPKAVALARQNAENHQLENKIRFFVGEWMSALKVPPYFDIILSNPPYIPSNIIPSLQPEIYRYEPLIALDGGEDGLDCLRTIINAAHHQMNSKGVLILEIGYDQKEAVKRMIEDHDQYEDIIFSKDYSGHDRVVSMRKK